MREGEVHGHGVDMAMGNVSSSIKFRQMHSSNFNAIQGQYYKQDGPGGTASCSETFAECFGMMTVDPAKAEKTFGPKIVEWMRVNILEAK